MFHHILLPTDGSACARAAQQLALQLAAGSGARVTGLYVLPLWHPDYLDAFAHHDPAFASKQLALFEKLANEYLSAFAQAAAAAGVACTCRKEHGMAPAAAIVAAARELGADLVCMSSHGWEADPAQLMGSVTSRVLHLSEVPVLVHKMGGRHVR